MAITNDETVWTEAGGGSSDFSQNGDYADAVVNNTGAQPAIFIRDSDSACSQMELKKDASGSYSCSFTSENVANRTIVGTVMSFAAEIDNIPITSIEMRWSSGGNVTSNYAGRDVLNNDFDNAGGWIIAKACGDDSGITSGSPNYGSIQSGGWFFSTGGGADGKLVGLDKMLSINYIQGNAQTVTLANLVDHSDTERLFVAERISSFYKFECDIRLGGSGTTNFAPTANTIYFNNLANSQQRGFDFASGGTTNFNPDGCSIFWNAGQDATNEGFQNANNTNEFNPTGCSFAAYPQLTLPANSANRSVNGNSFSNGAGKIIVGDCEFETNSISGAANGAEYDTGNTNRMVGNSYNNCTNALVVTGTGSPTMTLDGDSFNGNTTDIRWEGTGTLTVNVVNGANPVSTSTPNGGTVVINTPQTQFSFTVDPVPTPNYEYRLYTVTTVGSLAGATEVAGAENQTTASPPAYNHTFTSQPFALQIISDDYEEFTKFYTLTSNNISDTINLTLDSND